MRNKIFVFMVIVTILPACLAWDDWDPGDTSSPGILFDDFAGSSVDTGVWEIMDTEWADKYDNLHGGVVPENISVSNSNLVVEAHGDNYTGSVPGHGQNTRVGGAIRTYDFYASGVYEVKAKICPQLGALSAFWTFYYENEDYNHELDFEMPGSGPEGDSLEYGICTSWTGEEDFISKSYYFPNQNDGQYHYYRFEWYSGGNGIEPYVTYYFDGQYIATYTSYIPWHAGKWWLAIWFPTWAGDPDFDTDYMYVDWTKVTPNWAPNDIGETTGDPANYPPIVTASVSTNCVNLSNANTAILTGTVNDSDGPSVTYHWEKYGADNTAVINSPSSLSTTVTFYENGDYIFKLIANDGTHIRDAITFVEVISEPLQVDPSEKPQISPNPISLSSDLETVDIKLANLGGSARIYNFNGKQIGETLSAGSDSYYISWDIQEISPGTYFVIEVETREITTVFVVE